MFSLVSCVIGSWCYWALSSFRCLVDVPINIALEVSFSFGHLFEGLVPWHRRLSLHLQSQHLIRVLVQVLSAPRLGSSFLLECLGGNGWWPTFSVPDPPNSPSLLAVAWPSPGHLAYLELEAADESSLYFSLPASVSQLSKGSIRVHRFLILLILNSWLSVMPISTTKCEICVCCLAYWSTGVTLRKSIAGLWAGSCVTLSKMTAKGRCCGTAAWVTTHDTVPHIGELLAYSASCSYA